MMRQTKHPLTVLQTGRVAFVMAILPMVLLPPDSAGVGALAKTFAGCGKQENEFA